MKALFTKSKIIWLLIIIVVNILFALLGNLPQTRAQAKTNTSFFEVKPDITLSDYDDARILGTQYPAVNTPPSSLTYFIIHFSENYKLMRKRARPLFFAAKRIKELQTWGNLMRIEGNVKNLDDLSRGWDPYELGSIETLKNFSFDSWEVGLRRYLFLMEDEIAQAKHSLSNKKQGLIIDKALRHHHSSLLASLEQSVHNDEEKNYLLSLTSKVFTHLSKTLSTHYVDEYSLTKSIYTVPSLRAGGQYNIFYLENKPSTYQRQLTLNIKEKSLTPLPHEHTPDLTKRLSSTWSQVSIPKDTQRLILDTNETLISIAPAQIDDWKYEVVKSKTKHRYAVDMPIPSKEESYALIIPPNLSSNAVLEVHQRYEQKKLDKKTKKFILTETSKTIFKEDLKPTEANEPMYRRIDFPRDRNYSGAQLVLYTETKLSDEDLLKFRPNLAPIFEQPLYFENLGNGSSDATYSDTSQQKLPLHVPVLPIISAVIALLILLPTKLWITVGSNFFKFLRPVQSIVAVGVFIAVIADVLVFKAIHNYITLAILILWIVSNHGQRHRTSINLALALIMFTLSILQSLLGNTMSSEKSLIWMYVFFLTGLLSEFTYGAPLQEPRLDFITHIFEQTLKTALHQLRFIVVRTVLLIFGIENSRGVYRVRLVRLFLGIVISGAIALTLTHTVRVTGNIIIDFQTNQLIESRRPIITNIEPRIVYHGSKAIITGKRFGWQKDGERLLKNSQATIRADYWSDTKIEFTLPLDWRVGETEIWIEKFEIIRGERTITKSDIATVKLISRLGPWDADDDAYFEQLKSLSPEVLKLNGY